MFTFLGKVSWRGTQIYKIRRDHVLDGNATAASEAQFSVPQKEWKEK
jgi:hypothetical protein